MRRAVRWIVALVVVALVPTLLVEAQAWACVPIAVVTVLPNSSGPAGTTITVQGENFAGPVEIRWNSAEGPLLATASDPTAATTVKVPSVPSGLYLVIMLFRRADRTVGNIARAPFYVQNVATASKSGSSGHGALVLIAVIVALGVLGIWGMVLLRRGPPRSKSGPATVPT